MASHSSSSPASQHQSWYAHLAPFLWILLAVLLVRSFVAQPFSIPSGSMLPTLQVGDYLFVSKYDYGYSRFSLPFSMPLPEGRLFGNLPQRGDIVVFRLPQNNGVDYIKRVVGLPGDKIQLREGALWLNGRKLGRTHAGTWEAKRAGKTLTATLYRETLPNGTAYNTLDVFRNAPLDNTIIFEVPEGHLFVMGDNRDNSNDSRADVGFVPLDHIVGRAWMIYFSADGGRVWQIWNWPASVRAERIGLQLR